MSKKYYKKPVDKIIADQLMKNAIINKTLPLIRSALSVALGQHFVYKIKGSERILITDEKEIAKAFDSIEDGGQSILEYYIITTTPPNIDAIDKLFNRAYGKPKESLEIAGTLDFAGSLRALALGSAMLGQVKELPEIKSGAEALPVEISAE